jgi:hypothetical protein
MPATKDAMTRYRILDELLSNRYHQYSLDDLTEEVSNQLCDINPDSNGVTRRCIEKDLHYLEYESPFMVDIQRYGVPSTNTKTGKDYTKRCLRYSDPSYSIFKKELSDDEVYLLREALSLLGQFNGLPNLEALERLRSGLSVRKSDQTIISFTKNPLEETNFLGTLFTAISNKQVVEIDYVKFGKNVSTLKCRLHPYLLKEYNRRWYLIAASFEDGKCLTFALDRMKEVTPMPALKYVPYDGDIYEYFDDIIGVTLYDGRPIMHIEFWADDLETSYILTKPLHDSQKHYQGEKEQAFRNAHPQLSGGAFFSIDCIENYELIRELCSYGDGLVILSPSKLREQIKERISKMGKRYEI